MYYNNNWEKSKERYAAFWAHDMIDRAVMHVQSPKDGICEIPAALQAKDLYDFYNDPEFILKRNVERFNRTDFWGDAFASLRIPFAAAGHCCYIEGAAYEYRERTVWVHPFIKNLADQPIIFHEDNPLFLRHCQMLHDLCSNAKDRFLVGNMDNCGCIDALASLRGNSELLMDFLTEPELVKQAADNIAKALRYTNNKFYDILYPAQKATVNNWMGVYCEKKQIQVQCDLSVMVSTDIFEEFMLPDLELHKNWPDFVIYHLDGEEQIRHLDFILSCGAVDAIQWTPVAGQPKTSCFIPVLQKIQKAGKSLVLFPEPGEVDSLTQELSHKGLFMNVVGLSDREEAETILKIAEKNAHE